ncbi:MAG: PAS domain S-box protein [Candidatus Omnitrophica bacterium]|nr:PAS domain S-box protein [Candidatus Omnitrophota bacterium]
MKFFQIIKKQTNDHILALNKMTDESIKMNEQLRRATTGAHVALWEGIRTPGLDWKSPETKLIMSNIATEMLGYSVDEWVHTVGFLIEHIHPEDQERVMKVLIAYIEEQSADYIVDYRLRHKDGHYIGVHVEGEATRDDEGNVMTLSGAWQDITNRKETEKELKDNEDLLKKAQNIANLGYFKMDTDTQQVTGSDKLFDIFELKMGEHHINDFVNNLHPEDKEFVVGTIKNAVEKGCSYDIVHRLKTDNGEKWVRAIGEVNTDENGKRFLVGTVQDISDLKEGEKKLSLFWELMNHTYDSVFVIDSKDGRIIDANVQAVNSLGYSREELLQMKVMDLQVVIPDEGAWAKHREKMFVSGIAVIEGTHRRKDGGTFPVEVSVKCVKIEEKDYMIAVARDISERKKADQQRESLAKFPSENPNPVLRTTPEGVLIYSNNASHVLLDHCGCKLFDHMSEGWRKNIKMAFDEDQSVTVELEACDKILEFVIQPIREHNYVNLYGRDITLLKKIASEREKIMAQLFQSQKMESIGTIASGIAHNFNNILAAVRGRTEMAMADVDPESRVYSDLENAVSGIESAKYLIGQMMAFSRTHQQEFTEVDIVPLVKEAVKMFEASLKGLIKIGTKINIDCGYIYVDPHQIQHIILNLMNNSQYAIKGPNGTIDINVDSVLVDRDLSSKYSTLKEGKYIRLSIVDTGQGMDEETQKRIFEPFYTTKEVGQGTGLGLSMVYGIVTGCGGEISVNSVLGEGTTFNIYFPEINKE